MISRGKRMLGDGAMLASTIAASLLVVGALVVLLTDVIVHGAPRLSVEFLVKAPSNGMTEGGIFPAIFGTAALVIIMTVAVVPIGVATAIYLSEYARPSSRFSQLIRVAVNNLAGVPSIVFGLFGLGFFIQFLGKGIDTFLYQGQKVYAQPALVWGALTMAVLTLPVVIVATEEAIRAVPRELREAAFGLGATKFQTVLTVVLPQAAPGILTGTILAISRGAGEVAPILFTGAAYFLPQLPHALHNQFMHLGYHVYVLSTQAPDVDAAKPLLYATVCVLLGLTFLLNLSAMLLRARMRQRMLGRPA